MLYNNQVVETLRSFFATNNFIVYSVYGQVFFVMGLAVAFVRTKHSQLPLARSLWLLAAFGISHALYEWGSIFIPVQAEYMPPSIIQVLNVLHYILGAFSYVLLFQFAAMLLAGPNPSLLAGIGPAVAFAVWFAYFTVSIWFYGLSPQVLDYAEAVTRYALALPAALLTAYGLLGQARRVREMDLPRIAGYLRLAAVAFAVYALVGGMVVPKLDSPPALWFNYDTLLDNLGVPAPVFRSLCGLAMAYFIVRSLRIFDVELDRYVLTAERTQVLAAERERIGRDLHDGIIQSIYAAGLALEDAAYTIDVDQADARAKIIKVMATLDGIIAEIRGYIYNLSLAMQSHDLAAEAAIMVERFRVGASFTASFVVSGEERALSPTQRSHLLQILHEALSNVAKHSRARRVEVILAYDEGGATLTVSDDGVGFQVGRTEANPTSGYRQGLRNIAERASELGGGLKVVSAPRQGTRIIVQVPWQAPVPATVPAGRTRGEE